MRFPCSLAPFPLCVRAGFGKQAFQRTLFKINEDKWSELPSRTGHPPSRQRSAPSAKELTALPRRSESRRHGGGSSSSPRSGAAGLRGCWAALRLSARCAKVFLPLCSSGWDRRRAVLARVWAGGRAERQGSLRALRVEQAGKLAAQPCRANFVPLSRRRRDFLCCAFPLGFYQQQGCLEAASYLYVVLVGEFAATNPWLCWNGGEPAWKVAWWFSQGFLRATLTSAWFHSAIEKVLAFVCQLFML